MKYVFKIIKKKESKIVLLLSWHETEEQYI